MPSAGSVDENDVELILFGVGDGVFCDMRGVLAVALFIEFDVAQLFSFGKFFKVAGMDAELFDGAGSEGVAGCDDDAEVVLEEEEGEFG